MSTDTQLDSSSFFTTAGPEMRLQPDDASFCLPGKLVVVYSTSAEEYIPKILVVCRSDSPFSYQQRGNCSRIGFLVGTSNNFFYAETFNPIAESITIDAVAVAQQVVWSSIERKSLIQLLCCPLHSRMLRHVEVNDFSSVMRQNNKDIQYPECDGWRRASTSSCSESRLRRKSNSDKSRGKRIVFIREKLTVHYQSCQ
jgi:hypothetical protein